jgi:putative ABC transport system permease protein
MLKNYLKIALRNMKRNILYAIISIFGLGIGIACCIYIFLYVRYEFSYDTYHKDSDRIYRVAQSKKNQSKLELFATNVSEVAPTLKNLYPEVESAGLAGSFKESRVQYGEKVGIEDGIRLVNSGIFDIFSIPFIKGDPHNSLSRPKTIVISRTIASKYFRDEDPVGKMLKIDTTYNEVTAVMEDCPDNTHYKFTMLKYLDLDEFTRMGLPMQPWNGWNAMNYIKLRSGTDPKQFEEKIRRLPHQYINKVLESRGMEFTLFLQPITDIHLYSNLKWEEAPPGNPTNLYIFSGIGIFILLISCINFINLTIATSIHRAKEIGIRKVVGAEKKQIFYQFMGESFLVAFLSFILAITIVDFSFPLFNIIAGTNFKLGDLFQLSTLLLLSLFLIFIGMISGVYPSLVVSDFKPVSILRGRLNRIGKNIPIRKVMVVTQFFISGSLIIGTIFFYKQLNFMRNRHLGFDKEQKLVLEFNRSRFNPNTYQAVKNEFLSHSSIKGVTFSSSVPGRWMYLWRMYPYGEQNTKSQAMNCFQVDRDFFKEYKIDMAAGRSFDMVMIGDEPGGAAILNESAVKAFGWETPQEALNKSIIRENSKIIGVAKNFNYRGLQKNIEPLIIFLMSEDFRYITLNIDISNLPNVMDFVQATYKKLCPNDPIQYFFLDADFNKQYLSEEKTITIITIFTAITIFIACLGLFGLSSYIIKGRIKEIGIRKVLGCTLYELVFILSMDYVKLVIFGILISLPVSYYLINKWLQSFAYRIEISGWIFLFSGILTLVIAFLTVSFHTIKAARANPVESLKYE